MHDRNNVPLKVGDQVIIRGVITRLDPGNDYCNVNVETCDGRRPDGKPENIGGINTGVLCKIGEPATSSIG